MTYDPPTTAAAGGGIAAVTPPIEYGLVVAPPPLPETIPAGADPVEWASRCVAHSYHQPVPRYLELHHVIPRAWQGAWQPAGVAIPRTGIWHPETVPLCRTGHGNVHYWIERFMHEIRNALVQDVLPSPEEVARYVLARQTNVGRAEHVIARRALEEWVSAGGSLEMLADRGLYGGLYGGNEGTQPT